MPHLPRPLLALGLSALLAACQLSPGPGKAPQDVTPNAVTGDAIEVTALDAAPAEAARAGAQGEAGGGDAARVQSGTPAAPGSAATPAPQPDLAAEVALPSKSQMQLACERKQGRWIRAGKGDLHSCVYDTRDGGKQCTRESQCEGVCLARSGTCAPVKPLLGCNEILQDNGARVTLCID
ncbi:hypothetical protein [Tabrizicola sp.]|uniref:hypothetical protein n=1 Tax=Tabrizicola sp. TaxID=2005166 RepID=UPI0035B3D2FC